MAKFKFTQIGALWDGETQKKERCIKGIIDVHRSFEPRTTSQVLRAMADAIDAGETLRIAAYLNKKKTNPKSPDWRLIWSEPEEIDYDVGSPPRDTGFGDKDESSDDSDAPF